jgi:hypothetical protein
MTRRAKAAPDTNALAPAYEPTAHERRALEAYRARQAEKPFAPRMKVSTTKDGVANLAPDHPDPLIGGIVLLEALGCKDPDSMRGLVSQLANLSAKGGKATEDGINFLLAVVKGIEPRDQVEALLAAQMAAIHNATMTFARRLAHVDNIAQQDSAERAFNKLARTFTGQVEALKRYRSAGEQTVRVEHVTVNEGGQAIVGSVTHGGRGTSEKEEPTS